MFLTMWLGIINIKSGVGKYVNAGHLFPIVKHIDGTIDFIENEPNLFIGNFPEYTPKVNNFRLNKGDMLSIYTDGLTDSTNYKGELFGVQRLLDCISNAENNAEKICECVNNSITAFSNGKGQFDDITFLSLQCNGLEIPNELHCSVETGIDGTGTICDKVQNVLKEHCCMEDIRRNIGVVVDEICNNISEYAYSGNGNIIFDAEIGNNYIEMTFSDNGMKFNPLELDTTPNTEELQIGGLGIYLVKQLSDKISYEYSNNMNKLTVLFTWNL